jgi:hypothetical protein
MKNSLSLRKFHQSKAAEGTIRTVQGGKGSSDKGEQLQKTIKKRAASAALD